MRTRPGQILYVWDFNKELDEPYAWPGGYPKYFICADGEALSYEAARENAVLIRQAIAAQDNDDWLVVGVDINYEDTELYCVHTGERIPSAYGD